MKVLIVDDNAGAREMMRLVVEKLGHQVAGEASDGEGAVKAFGELRPDAVLLDIIMPGKSGVSAMEEILQLDPGARIIIVSAVDQDELNARLTAGGAAAVIRKPFGREDFERAFRELGR